MLTIALNTPLAAPAGRAPEWIQLLPDGPDVVGWDGRRWKNDLPDLVARHSKLPMVLDYEHASERRAPQGLPAPAAGWIDRLEVRGASAIWGHVDWTPTAAQRIQAREYRYLSPVFLHEKTGRIVRLTSAALTNQPNLPLTALNQIHPANDRIEFSALLAEFGDLETFLAYRRAVSAGASIVKPKVIYG